MKNLPKVTLQRLYNILKGRAQNIASIAHCFGELINTESSLNSPSLRTDRLPLCIQSSGQVPKLRCTFLLDKVHFTESSAPELRAKEHLGEETAMALQASHTALPRIS